ncbi:DUF5753 domain-containing protein [Streptomyces decoyicus]|uniref:DUF5753 domain-containing protein n=1 Tax=Streptomyces decoyicus TaxID=249567 RepID=UPI0033D5AC8F
MRPLFERTHWFRFYQSWVIPGLLQTQDYTRAILDTVASVRDTPGDTDEAVAARMERQRVLYTGGRRFAFLMEEWVLRTVIGDSATMVSQLGHLIAMTATPSLSLGVIPMGVVRGNAWPCESFSLYDEKQASCELVSDGLTVKQPSKSPSTPRRSPNSQASLFTGRQPGSSLARQSTRSGDGVQVRRISLS